MLRSDHPFLCFVFMGGPVAVTGRYKNDPRSPRSRIQSHFDRRRTSQNGQLGDETLSQASVDIQEIFRDVPTRIRVLPKARGLAAATRTTTDPYTHLFLSCA